MVLSVPGEGIEEVEISAPPSQEAPATPPVLQRERPIPFQSVVADVDPKASTLLIGKRKKRLLYIRSHTRLRHPNGSPATLADFQPGMTVRGSYRKLGPSEGEAVTVTIGSKADASRAVVED